MRTGFAPVSGVRDVATDVQMCASPRMPASLKITGPRAAGLGDVVSFNSDWSACDVSHRDGER